MIKETFKTLVYVHVNLSQAVNLVFRVGTLLGLLCKPLPDLRISSVTLFSPPWKPGLPGSVAWPSRRGDRYTL